MVAAASSSAASRSPRSTSVGYSRRSIIEHVGLMASTLAPRSTNGSRHSQVGLGVLAERHEIAVLPRRHAAALRGRRRSADRPGCAPSPRRCRVRAAGSLFCTKQVWKSTASPPGSRAMRPVRPAQASKVFGAKSGRSLCRWMPSTFSMNQRCTGSGSRGSPDRSWRAPCARRRPDHRAPGHGSSRRACAPAAPCSGARAWENRAGTRARRGACTGTAPRRACIGSRRP